MCLAWHIRPSGTWALHLLFASSVAIPTLACVLIRPLHLFPTLPVAIRSVSAAHPAQVQGSESWSYFFLCLPGPFNLALSPPILAIPGSAFPPPGCLIIQAVCSQYSLVPWACLCWSLKYYREVSLTCACPTRNRAGTEQRPVELNLTK